MTGQIANRHYLRDHLYSEPLLLQDLADSHIFAYQTSDPAVLATMPPGWKNFGFVGGCATPRMSAPLIFVDTIASGVIRVDELRMALDVARNPIAIRANAVAGHEAMTRILRVTRNNAAFTFRTRLTPGRYVSLGRATVRAAIDSLVNSLNSAMNSGSRGVNVNQFETLARDHFRSLQDASQAHNVAIRALDDAIAPGSVDAFDSLQLERQCFMTFGPVEFVSTGEAINRAAIQGDLVAVDWATSLGNPKLREGGNDAMASPVEQALGSTPNLNRPCGALEDSDGDDESLSNRDHCDAPSVAFRPPLVSLHYDQDLLYRSAPPGLETPVASKEFYAPVGMDQEPGSAPQSSASERARMLRERGRLGGPCASAPLSHGTSAPPVSQGEAASTWPGLPHLQGAPPLLPSSPIQREAYAMLRDALTSQQQYPATAPQPGATAREAVENLRRQRQPSWAQAPGAQAMHPQQWRASLSEMSTVELAPPAIAHGQPHIGSRPAEQRHLLGVAQHPSEHLGAMQNLAREAASTPLQRDIAERFGDLIDGVHQQLRQLQAESADQARALAVLVQEQRSTRAELERFSASAIATQRPAQSQPDSVRLREMFDGDIVHHVATWDAAVLFHRAMISRSDMATAIDALNTSAESDTDLAPICKFFTDLDRVSARWQDRFCRGATSAREAARQVYSGAELQDLHSDNDDSQYRETESVPPHLLFARLTLASRARPSSANDRLSAMLGQTSGSQAFQTGAQYALAEAASSAGCAAALPQSGSY